MTERISERVLYQRLRRQGHSLECFAAAKQLVSKSLDDSSIQSKNVQSYLESYAFRVARHVGDFFSMVELKTPSTLLACAVVSDLVNRGACTYDCVANEFRVDFSDGAACFAPEARLGLEGMVEDFTRMCLKGAALPPPFVDYSKDISSYQSRVSSQLSRLERENIESCVIALSNAVVMAQDLVTDGKFDNLLLPKTKIVHDYLTFAKKFDLDYFVQELEKSYLSLDGSLSVELKKPGSSDLDGIDLDNF